MYFDLIDLLSLFGVYAGIVYHLVFQLKKIFELVDIFIN